MSTYPNPNCQWDAFQVEQLSKTEVMKFILCEAREDQSTRLFVHKFSKVVSLFTKEGWWDTFTLATKECQKGFYLCRIQNFKLDRNGYLNMVVSPNKYLGTTINEESIGWDYLFRTGNFSDQYSTSHFKKRFNMDNLNRIYRDDFKNSGFRRMEDFVFNEFMHDRIQLDHITSALEEKYDIEKFAEKINKNLQTYSDQYPLFVKKLPKENVYGYEVYTTSRTVSYLEDKSMEYERLQLGDEDLLLERAEAVLRYWDNIHQERKAQKKAARKNKKQLENA